MSKSYLERLEHKIERCEGMVELLDEAYKGNEQACTFHAGWWLGYHQSKLNELKELRDDIQEGILSVKET